MIDAYKYAQEHKPDKVGDWIVIRPVCKVPPRKTTVLITQKRGDGRARTIPGSYDDGWWFDFFGIQLLREEVLAWQPLPGPYVPEEAQ